ncbi:MAG: hypothetical protein AABY22_14535, partial [Nanoarchaeota archaeon]
LGIKVSEINTDTEDSVSASKLRNAIANNDKKFFLSYMPEHLTTAELETIWNIITTMKNIKEMSRMASGNIAGTIDRKEFIKEILLRKKIQSMIKNIFESNKTNILRQYVRKLISEEAKSEVVDTVHASTGINVLEDLLKKIIPSLEQDYKILTSSESQRKSFRAHILNAVNKTLTTADINQNAGVESDSIKESMKETINVSTTTDQNDKFIYIDDKEEKEVDTFSIPGEDETGRNLSQSSYEKIEKNILDSYSVLSDNEDKKLFYDYLSVNLRLYFDKFEDELQTSIQEPKINVQDDETNSNNQELEL